MAYALPAQRVEFINTGYFSKAVLDSVVIADAYRKMLEAYPEDMRDSLPLIILYDPWFELNGKRQDDYSIRDHYPALYQRYASGHLIYVLAPDKKNGHIECVDATLLYPESAGISRTNGMRNFVLKLALNQFLKRYHFNPYYLPQAFEASFRRLDQLLQDEIYKSRRIPLAVQENRQYFKSPEKH